MTVRNGVVLTRAAQREQTRDRILEAAVTVFAERGFEAASTRAIGARAGLAQGLLTYHFRSKDELWRCAADRIFEIVDHEVSAAIAELPQNGNEAEAGRDSIRIFVRFASRHPEMFQFMMDAQSDPDGRCDWLVESHLRALYSHFATSIASFSPELTADQIPHFFYTMIGAGSLIFAVPGEARRLCELDVTDPATVEAHADFVAQLLLP